VRPLAPPQNSWPNGVAAGGQVFPAREFVFDSDGEERNGKERVCSGKENLSASQKNLSSGLKFLPPCQIFLYRGKENLPDCMENKGSARERFRGGHGKPCPYERHFSIVHRF